MIFVRENQHIYDTSKLQSEESLFLLVFTAVAEEEQARNVWCCNDEERRTVHRTFLIIIVWTEFRMVVVFVRVLQDASVECAEVLENELLPAVGPRCKDQRRRRSEKAIRQKLKTN